MNVASEPSSGAAAPNIVAEYSSYFRKIVIDGSGDGGVHVLYLICKNCIQFLSKSPKSMGNTCF